MRVVISGYYGFNNAGDEALLTAITEALRRCDESLTFVVLSGNPRQTAEEYGLQAVSRINPWVLFNEIRRSDLLISGGGSLLQDVTGPLSIPYYLGIVALAKLLGVPVVFYAQGIGPVRGWLGKKLIKLVANRVDLISLRDEESRTLLNDLGVTRPPILLTADPVFSVVPSDVDIQKGAGLLMSLRREPQKNAIGVALRRFEGFSDQEMAEFLDCLYEKGYEIVLLPMQHPEDLHYSLNLSRKMKYPAVIVEKPLKCRETMGLIANLQMLVGMRLHALIFAACAGTPLTGISYDPKVQSLLKMLAREPLNQGGNFDPRAAADIVHRSVLNGSEEVAVIKEKTAELKAQADDLACKVLEFVARNCRAGTLTGSGEKKR